MTLPRRFCRLASESFISFSAVVPRARCGRPSDRFRACGSLRCLLVSQTADDAVLPVLIFRGQLFFPSLDRIDLCLGFSALARGCKTARLRHLVHLRGEIVHAQRIVVQLGGEGVGVAPGEAASLSSVPIATTTMAANAADLRFTKSLPQEISVRADEFGASEASATPTPLGRPGALQGPQIPPALSVQTHRTRFDNRSPYCLTRWIALRVDCPSM